MPTWGFPDDEEDRRRKLNAYKAKLTKLGINPRSNKFGHLLHKYIRNKL